MHQAAPGHRARPRLEPEGSLQDEDGRVLDGRGAAGMKHVLETALKRPPGGQLELVARLKDGFVIRDYEGAGREGIGVPLRAANVVADPEVRGSEGQRVPVPPGDQ